jgi:hypothetical protein
VADRNNTIKSIPALIQKGMTEADVSVILEGVGLHSIRVGIAVMIQIKAGASPRCFFAECAPHIPLSISDNRDGLQ